MLEYKSFKGRKINFSQRVTIYKNLHNGLFSVKQNNLVVAHIEGATLKNAYFTVNKAGRNRVIKEQKKNVHAFVNGYLLSINDSKIPTLKRRISYNPYKFDCFYFEDSNGYASVKKDGLLFIDSKKGLFII